MQPLIILIYKQIYCKYISRVIKLFFLSLFLFCNLSCIAKVYVHHTWLDPKICYQLIAKHLPVQPIILDAGAFDGADTVILKKLWPKSIIHAFEPHPTIYLELAKKADPLNNLHTYKLGLDKRDGTATFYESTRDNLPYQSGSLIAPKEHLIYAPQVLFKNKIDISVVTIDSWAKTHHVDHVDFMWLDLQGSELDVMKAAPSIMKTVKAIMLEVEFVEAYKDQPLYLEIRHWLEDQGFELIATDFADYHSNAPKAKNKAACTWFGNILMLRK
jgi:FkbM family methyltransferase